MSLFLLSQLSVETVWRAGTKTSAQPALWPIISITGMTFFAFLNWTSSFLSPRIPGRWIEVYYWLSSIEYVLWFMAYVVLVPMLGYLPTSMLFAFCLAFRAGYRNWKMLAFAVLTAVAVVLVFKTFLQVKVPSGEIYELLPDSIRSIMLTYF